MAIKNVAIIGASGIIGPPVLDALLAGPFNVTVISRESSKATFPAAARVVKTDLNSVDALKTALTGIDAVISTVGTAALADQKLYIDAAIAAGVQRFLPSEYGSDTEPALMHELCPLFDSKTEIVRYLQTKQADMSWTAVVTGCFYDWGLANKFLGFDLDAKTATIFDSGDQPASVSDLARVGEAVVAVLTHAGSTRNRYVRVHSFAVSQNEILKSLEEHSGAKYSVKKVTSEGQRKAGFEMLQKGDWGSAFQPLILAATYGSKLGLFQGEALDNKKLGLKDMSVDESTKRTVKA